MLNVVKGKAAQEVVVSLSCGMIYVKSSPSALYKLGAYQHSITLLIRTYHHIDYFLVCSIHSMYLLIARYLNSSCPLLPVLQITNLYEG